MCRIFAWRCERSPHENPPNRAFFVFSRGDLSHVASFTCHQDSNGLINYWGDFIALVYWPAMLYWLLQISKTTSVRSCCKAWKHDKMSIWRWGHCWDESNWRHQQVCWKQIRQTVSKFIQNLLYPYVKMESANKRQLNTFVTCELACNLLFSTNISYTDLNIHIKNVQLSTRNTTYVTYKEIYLTDFQTNW